MTEPGPDTVAEALDGQTLLLTGASGFLGKGILVACLRELPGLGGIRVLLRSADDAAADRRLRDEVLRAGAFAGLDPEPALESGWLTAVAGDLTRSNLGRDSVDELAGVDVIIHCAASVSFEQPLDEMIELNTFGTLRLLEAVRASGSEPALVHVSTAYASGDRTGLVLERASGTDPAEPDVDLDAELRAARAWRAELESESRLPKQQKQFLAEAREELGPAGTPAVGGRAEQARRKWVVKELAKRGQVRCRSLGWTDAYTMSKALTERELVAGAAAVRPLTIVRPTTIESALRSPYPGWIEGLKVTDPVILSYGAGMIPAFPGKPSARIDWIPVDLVANACIAAAARPPEEVRTITVSSGTRNPLLIGYACEQFTEYFRERPLADEEGLPVEVADWKFMSSGKVLRLLDNGDRAISIGRKIVDRGGLPKSEEAEKRLHKERRRLERLRRLAEVYAPYVELDCMFDDRNAQALQESLHPEDRERFDFDPTAIDWHEYIHDIHLPALRELVRAPAPERKRKRRDALPDGPPAIAFFDVEGVVLDATVPHFYAWLRGRTMASPDRLVWLASMAARVPGWKAQDRRSRSAFNRSFYREYEGLPAGELRTEARAALNEFILPRIHHGAVRRIRLHRQRGDRVVLLTGALDFLIEPLHHLCDDLIAAKLVESLGAFTGELEEPPMTADGRASLTAGYAAQHGVDLADCHAYGDSISDLPMLSVVGHPSAVNPDFRLAREARRRRWPVLTFETEPGAKTRPREQKHEPTPVG